MVHRGIMGSPCTSEHVDSVHFFAKSVPNSLTMDI